MASKHFSTFFVWKNSKTRVVSICYSGKMFVTRCRGYKSVNSGNKYWRQRDAAVLILTKESHLGSLDPWILGSLDPWIRQRTVEAVAKNAPGRWYVPVLWVSFHAVLVGTNFQTRTWIYSIDLRLIAFVWFFIWSRKEIEDAFRTSKHPQVPKMRQIGVRRRRTRRRWTEIPQTMLQVQ